LFSLVGVRASVDSINILDDVKGEREEANGGNDDDDDEDDGQVCILELLVGRRASARMFAGRRAAATATKLRRDFIVMLLTCDNVRKC
jgi:hypothetical protein